jgi:hypothetical protein
VSRQCLTAVHVPALAGEEVPGGRREPESITPVEGTSSSVGASSSGRRAGTADIGYVRATDGSHPFRPYRRDRHPCTEKKGYHYA